MSGQEKNPEELPLAEEEALLRGYSEADRLKVAGLLDALLPHLDATKMFVVGGLAIRYYVTIAGNEYPGRPFNDLDIAVTDNAAVSPSVTDSFLIAHHHTDGEAGSYFALVHPITKTKVDIFGGIIGNQPGATKPVRWKEYMLRLPSIEEQLVKTVLDLQRISPESHVDPKQFQDAELLLSLTSLEVAQAAWAVQRTEGQPSLIQDAFESAVRIATRHPEWVEKDPFKKPPGYVCPECVETDDFPLTSGNKIGRILGRR